MFYHIRVEVKELWRTESQKDRKKIQKEGSILLGKGILEGGVKMSGIWSTGIRIN